MCKLRAFSTVFFFTVLMFASCNIQKNKHDFYDNEENIFKVGTFCSKSDTFVAVYQLSNLYRLFNIKNLPEFDFYDTFLLEQEKKGFTETTTDLYKYLKRFEVKANDSIYNFYKKYGIKELILNYDFEQNYDSKASDFYYVVYLCCLNGLDVFYDNYHWNIKDEDSGDTIDRDVIVNLPEFKFGMDSFERYIEQQTIQYSCQQNCRVVCALEIDSTGILQNVTALTNSCEDPIQSKRAIEFLSDLQQWIPATRNGKRINFVYYLAIKFKCEQAY